MRAKRRSWLRPFGELAARRRAVLGALAFVVPLGLWCLVSYVPFIWHPMVRVSDPGKQDSGGGAVTDVRSCDHRPRQQAER